MTNVKVMAFVYRLRDIAEWITTTLFFVIFVIYIAGIVARYVFSSPIAWSDELAMVAFVWCVFLTDAFVSRDKDQVAFDVLWSKVSPKGRRIIGLLQTSLFAVIFAAAFPTVLGYVMFLWREKTPALEWRLDLVYACFVIYMAMVVIRLVAKFFDYAGPRWREHVTDDDTAVTSNVIG